MAIRGLALVLGVGVTACADLVIPPFERLDIGAIQESPTDTPAITLPDTVALGQRFVIRVTTFGDGCVRFGETELDIILGRPRVIPLDYVTSGVDCDLLLQTFEHEVEWAFGQRGVGHVTVQGRVLGTGSIVSIVDTVWVR